MKFVKVTNPILSITCNEVCFGGGRWEKTFLKRVYRKKVIWKLKPDGIYVREEHIWPWGLKTA